MKAIDFECTWCKARVGQPCFGLYGTAVEFYSGRGIPEPVPYYHPDRVDAALAALAERISRCES